MKLRTGTTNLEVLIASCLLLAAMGLLVTIAPRIAKLWQSSRHHRLVLQEMTNQMDLILNLPENEREKRLARLAFSEEIQELVPGTKLVFEILSDDDGRRILLQLQGAESVDLPELSLVGWIPKHSADGMSVEGSTP